MGFFSKAVSRLEELKKQLGKEPGSRQFLALAEEYRKAGKTREMIETLEGGVVHHPSYVAGIVSLARAYHQAGRPDDALRTYQSALKIDRENLVAIRQSAEIYLEKGEKVEAIKKLKLFRALSPGDREVAEKIEWLDADLAAARPKPGPRVDTWPAMNVPLPAPRPERPAVRAEGTPVSAPGVPSPVAVPPRVETPLAVPPAPPPPPAPPVEIPTARAVPEAVAAPPLPVEPPSEPVAPRHEAPRSAHLLEMTYDLPGSTRRRVEVPPPTAEPAEEPAAATAADLAPTVVLDGPAEPPDAGRDVDSLFRAESPEPSPFEVEVEIPADALFEDANEPPQKVLSAPATPEPGRPSPEPPPAPHEALTAPLPEPVTRTAPAVTETLAELYRTQGHHAEARKAFLDLAREESDPARAKAWVERAAEIGSPLAASTAADRLGLFADRARRARPRSGPTDLDSLVSGLVAGSGGGIGAAILTDLEGIPIVSAGSGRGAPAQEVLVAQLTAFCKGLGRTAEDVGVGPLESLAVSGETATVALAQVGPGYALILHATPDYPVGRLRYEADAAAGRLRPLL